MFYVFTVDLELSCPWLKIILGSVKDTLQGGILWFHSSISWDFPETACHMIESLF